MDAGASAVAVGNSRNKEVKRVPGAVLGLSGACRANREALLPPPVLGSHHSCSDAGRLEEVHTHRRGSGAFPRWGCRLAGSLWSHGAAAVHSQKNISCLVMAAVSLGGRWLFPGPPPFWRVCHTSQAQGLITWLISGQRPAPATAQGPCQLGVAMASCSVCFCQGVPGTAVWGCLSWLLSPQPLLICQKRKYSKLGFCSQSCLKAKENASALFKSLAGFTAVRASTPLNKVYKTLLIQTCIWSWPLEGSRPPIGFIPTFAIQTIVSVRFQEKSVLHCGTGILCSPAVHQVCVFQAPVTESFLRAGECSLQ